MSERLTDEQLRDWRDEAEIGAMMSPFETLSVLDALVALRAENERLTKQRDAASKLWRGIAETDSAGVRELRGENERLREDLIAECERRDEIIATMLRGCVLTQIDNATTITKSLRAENERLREALKEATAELIYLRQYGKDGAVWWANESKDVWRDKARAALED